tara:strand:+ start:212 stop:1375 length:1164 start_codon:yes stop_codon:yes gene_type:complete
MKLANCFSSNKNIFFTNNFFLAGLLAIGTHFSTIEALSTPNILKNNNLENSLNKKKSFITLAIEKAGPSVVTIQNQRLVNGKTISKQSNILLDPYFEKFFGLRLPKEIEPRIEESQGSGFILEDGLVITNAHVVSNSDKLIVGLSDGRKFEGTIIGQDSISDLAVIKLNGKGPWPKATLGDSNQIQVGDWAIAVGNPFGLENTVTLGIISNLNRNVSQLGIYDKRFNLIQTDAAINPGNSGGPLLNERGEVVGINTLIRSGPGAGLSFAIPINKAQEIAKQLIATGKVTHPMIGITLINELSSKTNNNKVKVGYVVPNSPAAKSGILIGDILLKVDQSEIKESSDVINAINKIGVNKFAKITIKRNNKIIKFSVKPVDIRILGKIKN